MWLLMRALTSLPGKPIEDEVQRFRMELEIAETQENALEPSVFTAEYISFSQHLFHCAFLNGWRLELSLKRVPVRAVEDFLTFRYGLRRDDVDHEDIFGWERPGAHIAECVAEVRQP